MIRTVAVWVVFLAVVGGAGTWYVLHRRAEATARRELEETYRTKETEARQAYAKYRYWAKTNGIFDATNVENMRGLREEYLFRCRGCAPAAECEKVARAMDAKPEDAMMWTVCRSSVSGE